MTGAPIVMPKLGLTMTEGLVAAWKVKPGDSVAAGDVLFVVETEKIATEVEAQIGGRIATIEVPEGTVVPVGTPVATWAGAADGAPPAEPRSRTAPDGAGTPGSSPDAVPDATGARRIATPLARKLARASAIELDDLEGSGPRGRIKACDVEAALARRREGAGAIAQTGIADADALSSPLRGGVGGGGGAGSNGIVLPPRPPSGPARRPASAWEKTVARRLVQAKQTIPHFYVQADADVTRLLALREELNAAGGYARVSLTHFVLAAVGRALARVPEINLLWADDEVIQLAETDVGLAIDTDRGLVAPVVRRAGGLSLDALVAAASHLIDKAKAGRLEAQDLEGGAISVSNVGMFGASHLTPIINPGQSAILGVAAVRPAFRPDAAGQPTLRQELGLVLSCDHRVIDGVRAARFLDLVTQFLQQPLSLLRNAAPPASPT